MKDLLILIPDKDISSIIKGLLNRKGFVQAIDYDSFQHEDRDHGVRKKFEEVVRGKSSEYHKLLVIFDRHGSGDHRNREVIESEMENRIGALGWKYEDIGVVCIEPEIEQWLWVNQEHIKDALKRPNAEIYPFLQEKGWVKGNKRKPEPPKEAWEALLKNFRTRSSPVHFEHVGANGSIYRCQDAAFLKLRDRLINWFGERGN